MIRPLEEDDLDDIATLEERDGDVHWSRAQFEKELTSEFVRFFVLTSDVPRLPAGQAGPTSDVGPRTDVLGYGGYWKAGPEAQITNLVIRRESRCQGHAKRLLEFLFDCARSEQCSAMTLEVRAQNTHAMALYAKMGFAETGRRTKFYKAPEDDAVMMEKTL